MGLGGSLLLIAVGAILRYAVTVTTEGLNLQTVGLILMIVGGVGFVISLFWMVVWADRTRDEQLTRDRPGDRGGVPRSSEPRY